jgi:large subunit ribosomal protein L35
MLRRLAMPKLKTHKGAKRRFHITGTGKVMHRKGAISHLRNRKSKRAKAQVANLRSVRPALLSPSRPGSRKRRRRARRGLP